MRAKTSDLSGRRLLQTAVLFGALAAIVAALTLRNELPPSSFKAFYCAGVAVNRGADPYLVEPLRACEHGLAHVRLSANAVEPAPFPGYALAGWAILARAPYDVARATFLLLMLAGLAAAGVAVSRIAALPPLVTTLPFVALWFLNLAFGELPPVAAAAGIALCAWALYRKRPWLAAVAAALAAVEPHVALPLWIALAISKPSLRIPLAVVGGALLALDIAVGGVGRALEYFVNVLPAQAASEIHAIDQFSLTHLLSFAGLGDTMALRIGGLSYIVAIAAGVAVAHRIAKVERFAPYIALVPPVFVLLGGTYVHDLQFIVALPLAIVMLARKTTIVRAAAALLLSIPWTASPSRLVLVLTLASVCGVLAIVRVRPSRLAAGAMAAALVIAFALFVHAGAMARGAAVAQRRLPGTAPAAQAWREHIEISPALSRDSLSHLGRKVPIWLGSSMLICVCLSVAYSGRRVRRRDLGRGQADQRLSPDDPPA